MSCLRSDDTTLITNCSVDSVPSLKSLMACLHFRWRFSINILKYSLLFKTSSLSWKKNIVSIFRTFSLLGFTCSYFEYIKRRCWYVSGRMSKMKGGEFLRFNLGLWHNLTTLSINFQVFSMVFRLISNLKYNWVKWSVVSSFLYNLLIKW